MNVSPGGTLAILRIGNLAGAPAGASYFRSIVTECNIQEAANANVMYAADGHVYMHVPGDKVGSLTVSGMSFSGDCDSHRAGGRAASGLEGVLGWYRINRVSNPSVTAPMEIVLSGNTLLKGYLGGISGRMMDAATRLQQFTLSLYIAPGILK